MLLQVETCVTCTALLELIALLGFFFLLIFFFEKRCVLVSCVCVCVSVMGQSGSNLLQEDNQC